MTRLSYSVGRVPMSLSYSVGRVPMSLLRVFLIGSSYSCCLFHQPCGCISWIRQHLDVGPVYWVAVVPCMFCQGRIPCSNCPASYIGQTKRRLHQRIEEHKRAVRQADFNSSALAEHAWNHSHPVDWSNIKVLSNPRDTTTRLVEEAAAIRRTKNTLNRDIGSDSRSPNFTNFSAEYLPVEYQSSSIRRQLSTSQL